MAVYRCANGHTFKAPGAGKSLNCVFLVEDNREYGLPSVICPEEAYIDGTVVTPEPVEEEPRFCGVDSKGQPIPANDAARLAIKDPQWIRKQKRTSAA
jgi:hypothetical protein